MSYVARKMAVILVFNTKKDERPSGSGSPRKQTSQKATTLFLKRNATFWKLPFFWRRVYTGESGVMTLTLGTRKNP